MITKDRQYREFEVRVAEEGQFVVNGYAATFNQPTVMYSCEGMDFKEVINSGAFNRAEMVDVVMNFNHSGKPVARTKNKTLVLAIDNIGLRVSADLSGTEEGRKLYEEIKGGYIDKMSFAFTVSEEEYDQATHTRHIAGFKRIFDVSCVDFPAYDSTSISARSFFEAEAERELAEARAKEKMKCKLRLKIEMEV